MMDQTKKAEQPLYMTVINCPHTIEGGSITLRFDAKQPGHNALNQLAKRLEPLEQQLTAPRGTDEQILHERKLTTEAINGAIAFGYQGTNPPPSDNHWLATFWKIGARLREIENRGSTPAAAWRGLGEADPHGTDYDGERSALTLGKLTDDELANGVFMNGNSPVDINHVGAKDPEYYAPIVWLTAAKERIRWLSRALVKAQAKNSSAISPGAAGPNLTRAQADSAVDDFEIVGENNASRAPTDDEKFVLHEFVARLFENIQSSATQPDERAAGLRLAREIVHDLKGSWDTGGDYRYAQGERVIVESTCDTLIDRIDEALGELNERIATPSMPAEQRKAIERGIKALQQRPDAYGESVKAVDQLRALLRGAR